MWILDETKGQLKLEPKSVRKVFVGFMEGLKSVRYWDKDSRVVRVSMRMGNLGNWKWLRCWVWGLRRRFQ